VAPNLQYVFSYLFKSVKVVSMNYDLRKKIIASIYRAGSGHPGGALSAIDILEVLFKQFLKISPKNLYSYNRDRFILSKGHAAPALYAVAESLGILNEGDGNGLRKFGTALQGHTDRNYLPWVEASTGSLGQGFSFGVGQALGFKLKNENNKIYVMCGDGEMQEGQIWEGVMLAAHYNLDNLCLILDYNKLQSDDFNSNINNLEPIREKFIAFNWKVEEIDGHKPPEIFHALSTFLNNKDAPTLIIAHTIKGKGVSFMEGIPSWHGSVKLSQEDCEQALKLVGGTQKEIKEILDV